MINSTFLRNIIIHSEIKKTSAGFKHAEIPLILLKGAALIEMYEHYCTSRAMDDIDILISPDNFTQTAGILKSLGYIEAYSDPFSFHNKLKNITIDICTGLWYLNAKENKNLIVRSLQNELIEPDSNCYRPPLEDIYLHIISHSVIHHLEITDSAKRDISLIEHNPLYLLDKAKVLEQAEKYCLMPAIDLFENRNTKGMRGIILKHLFKSKTHSAGHLARFALLPFFKQLTYLINSLFPEKRFIKYRYNLTNKLSILTYRILRPFLIFANLLMLMLRIVVTRKTSHPATR